VWLLIGTRLLEGLSTASNAPATLGYIAETTSHSEKLRTRIVGFYEIATIGGMALGFTLGGWLWRSFGQAATIAGIPFTSPAFALNALIYLASLAILWLGIHEIREKKKTTQPAVPAGEMLKRYWAIISSPRVAGFAPAWIAINGVLGVWMNLSARVLTDKHGPSNQLLSGLFDSFHAGNISAAYAVFFIVGILIWSMAFPNVRRNTTMLIGTGGLFISCLILYGINHQAAANAPLVLPLGILLVITIMIQSGFTPAALAHLADITEGFANDRGAIMGLYSVFLGLGQFLGASLGGIFVDWASADGMILFNGLLGLFAAFLLLRLRRLEDRDAVRTQISAR
jgi:MFS family permease